ncbi:hypothetical protein KJ966_04545 [bacterium]|nr:hypothetical protein [bacterium]
MLPRIAKKRTSFEIEEWENVRELMPRKRATRGIQYEALEFLFEHLYEKVSEEELREHFLRVKGRLQQKGDPVKSAINLAIKELQRLNQPKFDIIKIQEASLVGKTRRYVQLNFTGIDSVINYTQFCEYLEDMLANEDAPVIRSIYNSSTNVGPMIFPGIKDEWLQRIQAYALINTADQLNESNSRTTYYFIPDSQTNQCFLLLYEREDSELPFLAFVSNISSLPSVDDSQYLVYRGEEKLAKLRFYHNIWRAQMEKALDIQEASNLWEKATEISGQLINKYMEMTPKTVFKGLITTYSREK